MGEYIGSRESEITSTLKSIRASTEDKLALVAENMGNLEVNAASAFQKFAYVIMQNKEVYGTILSNTAAAD